MIVYDFSPISDFYYSVGDAETDVPWFRPDPDYLNKWKKEFFIHPESEQYRYFFHGASRQGIIDTWDVDISIHGPAQKSDYHILERVMFLIRQIGFKNRQLIEPVWHSRPIEYYELPACDHFQTACSFYLDKGSCTFEECLSCPRPGNQNKRIRYGRFIKSEAGTREISPTWEVSNESSIHIEYYGNLVISNIQEGAKHQDTKKIITRMN